jgi:hypothetical protein
VLQAILETHVDGLDLDVPGELAAIHVAVFGPARWGEGEGASHLVFLVSL